MTGIFGDAIEICRGTFEDLLAEVGESVTWRARGSAVPATDDSDISAAAGRLDPVTSEVPGSGDDETSLYTDTNVLAVFNMTETMRLIEAGMLTAGHALVYVPFATQPAVGDLIIRQNGEQWMVRESHPSFPPVHFELTLQRSGT
jgi:hypothetical protein